METKAKEDILGAVRELEKHPIHSIFKESMEDSDLVGPDYKKIIKHPMDLSLVLSKLNKNEYSSVSEWDQDMELIWGNAERYFGEFSAIGASATYMRAIYKKKTVGLVTKSWCHRWYELKSRLDALFAARPISHNTIRFNIDFSKPIVSQLLSMEDMKWLLNAVDLLRDPSDEFLLLEVLRRTQPELITDGIAHVDLTRVAKSTYVELRSHIEKVLESRNLSVH